MTTDEYIDHYMPSMQGWCSPEKARAIACIVKAAHPKIYVEIGVFGGRSLFAAGVAMAEMGEGGQAIGIDPWETGASVKGFNDENKDWWGKIDHEAIYKLCVFSMRKLRLDNTCALYRNTSAGALEMATKLSPFDILHVDGNHSEESALFDVHNYTPLVASGGTILFDDMNWNTTRAAQEFLATVAVLDQMVGDCGVYTKD